MEIQSNEPEGTLSQAFSSIRELAKHFGFHEDTLRKWLKQYPELPRLNTPSGVRLRVSEVMAWLNAHSTLMRKVEAVRLRYGMSKTALASELETTTDALRAWMTGRTVGRKETVARIRDFLERKSV
jgi:hypothetical protein